MVLKLFNWIRACVVLLRCIAHLLGGVHTIIRKFPHSNAVQKSGYITAWAQRFLAIVGVKLQVRGAVQTQGPLMVVANHISWLDILVLMAAQPVRFVSKADVKHWPVVGWLATHVGTLYIERESRRDALRVVHHVAQALQAGHTDLLVGNLIAVFPEGTTSDGTNVLPFHANLVQAALVAGAPVQPVALRFQDAKTAERRLEAAYVGDDILLTSVWRVLCANGLVAVVHYAPAQHADGRDRRRWCADLQAQVQERIGS